MKIDKDLLKEKCKELGYPIQYEERKKENNILTGITFSCMRKDEKKGTSTCPIFYVEKEELTFNGDYEALVISLHERAKSVQENFNIPTSLDFLESWDIAKKQVRATLRSDIVELENLVSVPFLNLYIIFYINIPLSEENFGMAKISTDIFKKWNVSLEDLFTAALINSSEVCIHVKGNEENPFTANQFSVTNRIEDEGSIALAHPTIIPALAKQFDCNFIIVAPTVHKIELLKTDKEDLGMSDIFSLLTQLQPVYNNIPEDIRLSNLAYFYNRNTGKLTLCD